MTPALATSVAVPFTVPEGHDEPPAGFEHWRVTLELWFPEQGPPDEPQDVGLAIARVLDAMSASAEQDPTLGGQVDRAQWRGTDGSQAEKPGTGPEAFPLRVEAYMTLQTTAGS